MRPIAFLFILNCLLGCQDQESKIETLITKANCKGPGGVYTTEVHANTSGYTLFHQEYSYRDYTYTNISYNDSTGVVLRNDSLTGKIGRQKVFFGKGHSFHFIAEYPESYFYRKPEGGWQDLLGNETTIQFDSVNNRLVSFEFINPFDTSQTINVVYSDWQDFDGFSLAKNIKITQADTLEFRFDYEKVLVNSEEFEKRQF